MGVAGARALETEAVSLGRISGVLADRVPLPLLVCDPSGTVRVANAASEDLLSRSREDLIGRRLATSGVFDAKTAESWFAGIDRATEPWTETARAHTPAGTFPTRVCLHPLRWGTERCFALALVVWVGEEGQDSGCFAYRLSNACTAVSRYASGVAHDLRNPLTGISTGVQYLARLLKDDSRHGETLEMILAELRRLDATIQRLTRVHGQCAATLSRFDLRKALGEALACHRKTIEAKRLAVSMKTGPLLPPWTGDRQRITRAFSAVFECALSASAEESTVRVRAGLESVAPIVARRHTPGPWIVVEVGCRTELIDPRQYIEAFDPSSPAWDAQMGLYLAAEIVEAHGGFVEVCGTPGRRIHFAVVIPANSD